MLVNRQQSSSTEVLGLLLTEQQFVRGTHRNIIDKRKLSTVTWTINVCQALLSTHFTVRIIACVLATGRNIENGTLICPLFAHKTVKHFTLATD